MHRILVQWPFVHFPKYAYSLTVAPTKRHVPTLYHFKDLLAGSKSFATSPMPSIHQIKSKRFHTAVLVDLNLIFPLLISHHPTLYLKESPSHNPLSNHCENIKNQHYQESTSKGFWNNHQHSVVW
jgi:hypothetical protein